MPSDNSTLTVQEIPLIPISNQQLNCQLNKQNCTIKVYQRDERLYLDLHVGLNVIQTGRLCIPYAPIITGTTSFSGQLYIVDTLSPATAQTTPHYSGLGTQYKLYYLPPEAVAKVNDAKYQFYTTQAPSTSNA